MVMSWSNNLADSIILVLYIFCCSFESNFNKCNRPHIVKEYNKFMGGIDLLDACVARYKYHMRSHRWYIYLFWQTIMLGLVNAWLIYRRDCKQLGVMKPLKQRSFQAEVATSLILVQAQRGRPTIRGTSSLPPPPPKRVRVGVPDDVRTDQVAHWPAKCDNAWPLQILQSQCNHHCLWEMWCASLLHWGQKLLQKLPSALNWQEILKWKRW